MTTEPLPVSSSVCLHCYPRFLEFRLFDVGRTGSRPPPATATAATATATATAGCDYDGELERPFGESLPSSPLPPSETEMEEFFLVAERQERKRFADKYNYDVVKDVPMEGRYKWFPILS
ncbi:unnamed protein product [Spirodela intermedia]|uniref:Cyclin-dependent kinase inhibitor domain-containing protein n=1 Tax=Spirodela intermedia TaxID=51605 RepID=A0A7I8J5D1_SPIIN|nr:unnamed protein product [Spirodela intermedia]CAA6664975.1 unnamed protein product [Spirodela intermedia]